MEIKSLMPRRGDGTLRIDDSDDFVVMENVGVLPEDGVMPEDGVCIEDHGVIVICTEGMAQFEYDGKTIQLRKNDMFIYFMLRSVISDFMSSQNFNCRQIWFTAQEAWSIDMHGSRSLGDLVYLKQHPKVKLTDQDAGMLNDYFQLLCQRMRNPSPILHKDIVRSLWGTMLLEILCIVRRETIQDMERESQEGMSPDIHRKRLADNFMQLVEQSDGRIRKVDDFARQLNVTPKYLSVLLKETMNRRPSDVIQLFTLKAIERRLRFSDMTMQEIANDLNFANASFFGKYVKEHLGMSPLEYRKKYQQ
jgi:AraC-like DNA-binding protein